MPFAKTSYYALALGDFGFHLWPEPYRLLQPIGEAIGEAEQCVSGLRDDLPQDHIDAVVEDEYAVVENLLGLAFVTCQTFITQVVSTISRVRKHARQRDGYEFTSTGPTKASILASFSPPVPGTSVTMVQLINAAANYFKHSPEWGLWDHENRTQVRENIDTLIAVGVRSDSRWKLRSTANALGIDELKKIGPLGDAVEEWSQALHAAYRKEAQIAGLLQMDSFRKGSSSNPRQ